MTAKKTTETKAETPAAPEGYVAPHINRAYLSILKDISVDKNGVLPSNMGGKPYIAAVDVAKEVKALLVKNDVISVPRETEVRKELVLQGNRLLITTTIEAEYDLISTIDGSILTIRGVGDGVATGSAVASNIASTNAFKNAFLRALLITEQSVEDDAKKGIPEPEKENRAVANAKGATKEQGSDEVGSARQAVKAAAASAGLSDQGYINWGKSMTGGAAGWVSDVDTLKKLASEITEYAKGVVPDHLSSKVGTPDFPV